MVAQLCHYLLVQGYPAEEITILAAYRKQIACINKEVGWLGGSSCNIIDKVKQRKKKVYRKKKLVT